MKYAIILATNRNTYLLGFTNTSKAIEKTVIGEKYTVELKELDNLFIPLEGDAAIYLS